MRQFFAPPPVRRIRSPGEPKPHRVSDFAGKPAVGSSISAGCRLQGSALPASARHAVTDRKLLSIKVFQALREPNGGPHGLTQ
jgi:hypothetical protein